MTLDFLSLYNECAGQPWSMYDGEVASDEDFEQAMKISINKAINYVWNLYCWNFRENKYVIKTKENKSSYSLPDGTISKQIISGSKKYCVKYGRTYLEYNEDYPILDEKFGEPEFFYVENNTIYIYPTPDAQYKIEVDYYVAPFGLDEEENDLYELVNDTDYINIPEQYETYFKNVVISKAMLYAITDTSDENDSGYREQYQDALGVLLKNCYKQTKERKVII